MRHHEQQGEEAGARANHGAAKAQRELLDGLRHRAQAYDVAGDEAGMDAGPVEQRIEQVAGHRRDGDLGGVLQVDGVAEGIRHEEPTTRLGGGLGLDGGRIGEGVDRLPRRGDGLSAERGSVRPVWQDERDLRRVAAVGENQRHPLQGVGHGAADLGGGRFAGREQVDRREDFQGGRRRLIEADEVRGPHAQLGLGQAQPVADLGAAIAQAARQLGPKRGRRLP